MARTLLTIPVTSPFDFRSALNAHGWVDLLPNTHDPSVPSFSRVEAAPSGSVVRMTVSEESAGQDQHINIHMEAPGRLSGADKDHLRSAVSHMLRMDEDFSEFYALCAAHGGRWKSIGTGIGRLLRSPTVFEDLVKVICTTNVQWGGTKRMVRELVQAFGLPFIADPAQLSFPSPAAIARYSFDNFRQKVRLGYREEYIYRLACQFADGELSAVDFQDSVSPTDDIRKKLLALKGIGGYASASMLMLLGRYDHIPVDTVFRQFMAGKYAIDVSEDLSAALEIYSVWGRWKHLAYWFDMLNFESPSVP